MTIDDYKNIAPFGCCPGCNTPLGDPGWYCGDRMEDCWQWCHQCKKRVPPDQVVCRPPCVVDPFQWVDKPDAYGTIITREAMIDAVTRKMEEDNMAGKASCSFKIQMSPELEEAFKKATDQYKAAEELLCVTRKMRRAAILFFIFGAIFSLAGVISMAVSSGMFKLCSYSTKNGLRLVTRYRFAMT